MTYTTYIKYIVLFCLLIFGSVGAFNYVIDPYDIFGTQRYKSLNLLKSDINNVVRSSKAFSSNRGKYDLVIVGNSRIEMGLSPTHECFTGKNVYNLGLPGASVRQQNAYALNMLYKGSAKHFLVALDFVDFLVSENEHNKEPAHFIPRHYKNLPYKEDQTPNDSFFIEKSLTYYNSLFSLNSLLSSSITLLNQNNESPDRTINGFNPANDFKLAVSVEGVDALFTQKLDRLKSQYNKKYYLTYRDGTKSNAQRSLEYFLERVKEQGGTVTFITNPFHQYFWDALGTENIMPLYTTWIKQIRSAIAEYPETALWDFSQPSIYTNEQGMPNKSKKPLQWFWEPSHYRKELGDLMISTVYQEPCKSTKSSLFKGAQKIL